MAEKRKFIRWKLSTDVKLRIMSENLKWRKEVYHPILVDVGFGGMQIETPHLPPELMSELIKRKSLVDLEFILPSRIHPIKTKAEVRWITWKKSGHRMGIRFIVLGETDKKEISRCCRPDD